MQFKINKKSNYLIIKHKDGRDEYEINILLSTPDIDQVNLEKVFENVVKYSGNVVIFPDMGYIFENEDLITEFTYLNGKLLKQHNKVAIFTQGNFSLGNLNFSTYGKNVDYIHVYTPKLQVGIISPILEAEKLKPENLPDKLQDAQVIMAKDMHAQQVLSLEYPVYIFWGDTKVFEQTTGITEYDKKETITLKKVDQSALTRTVYFLV